jgi:hypothetical protein
MPPLQVLQHARHASNPHWQWQNALMLDFTPLSKAVATLASALQETAVRGDDLPARDGCIQLSARDRVAFGFEDC